MSMRFRVSITMRVDMEFLRDKMMVRKGRMSRMKVLSLLKD